MICIIFLTTVSISVGLDLSVTIRDTVQVSNHTITDGFLIENTVYPDGSPTTALVNTTTYQSNITLNKSRNITVNKYTYSGTSSLNISDRTNKVCVRVTPVNQTDTNTSNNEACQNFVSGNATESNKSAPHGNTANGSENTRNASVDETNPDPDQTNTSEPTQCNILQNVPPIIAEDQSITFDINAERQRVTYWAEDKHGTVIKDAVTTDNSGEKQFTPDESWVSLHASSENCPMMKESVGVKTAETSSFVSIESLDIQDRSLHVQLTHHAESTRTIDLQSQGTTLSEISLPGGRSETRVSLPLPDLKPGVSKIVAEADDDQDAYKYHLDQEQLRNRYPTLIQNVYHRKEYYGPTTLFVSLRESVNGHLTVHQLQGNKTVDIDGKHIQTTVIPEQPSALLGVTVKTNLSEVLDQTHHRLDLQVRNKTVSESEPEQIVTNQTPQEEEQMVTRGEPVRNTATGVNVTDPFDRDQRSLNHPVTGGMAVLASLGYGAYRLRRKG